MNTGKIVLALPRLTKAIDTVLEQQAGQPVMFSLIIKDLMPNDPGTVISNEQNKIELAQTLRKCADKLEKEALKHNPNSKMH